MLQMAALAESSHEGRDSRSHELGYEDAGDDGDAWGHQDIDPCFPGYDLAQLCGHDGGYQGTYGSAQVIAGDAHGGGGEEHQLGRL